MRPPECDPRYPCESDEEQGHLAESQATVSTVCRVPECPERRAYEEYQHYEQPHVVLEWQAVWGKGVARMRSRPLEGLPGTRT